VWLYGLAAAERPFGARAAGVKKNNQTPTRPYSNAQLLIQ
jgi:hypothetical protein